ncbi:hypothetical protein HFZ78_18485 [Priestia megaterium]|uniref:Uncharacterized protein n=1 Tax=Priestia megaterium TaxID=1404 RepID=A0A6H1P4T0_PRIMG|nr:hypothetical protein [Priestia megaterium]QIZ08452.1 hypothetical protein HFZ78_18485 [Priestia megaterium]
MEKLTIEGLKTVINENTEDLYYFSDKMLNDGIYIKYKVLQPVGIPGPKGLKHSHIQVGNLKVTGDIVSIAEYYILYWDVLLSDIELYRMIKDTYEIYNSHSRSEFGELMRERAESGAISPTPKKLDDNNNIINDLLNDIKLIKRLGDSNTVNVTTNVSLPPNAPTIKGIADNETALAGKAEPNVDLNVSQVGTTFMQIIKDGRLMNPLYHGTSTLFLDDILTKGLGAENPIKKHNIMETLEKLVKKGYEYNEYLPKSNWSPNSEHWLLKKNNMIVNNEIANHRYGGVYLTPSKFTAVRYTRNKYGSELISNTIILYHFLKENSVPVELDNDFLSKIINCSYDPVVIIASCVDCSLLQSENNNKPVDDTFKDLQYFLEEGFDPQQTNFELPQPNIITPEHLTVLSVEEYNNIKEKHNPTF